MSTDDLEQLLFRWSFIIRKTGDVIILFVASFFKTISYFNVQRTEARSAKIITAFIPRSETFIPRSEALEK